MPVAVAALELHAPVDTGGIAPEDLLDQADGFDVLVPVQRRAEPQAGDGVAHREVVHRLPLILGPDGVFHRGAGSFEPLFQLLPEPGRAGPVLAHALEQLAHEGDVKSLGKRRQAAVRPRALEVGEVALGFDAAHPALDQFLGEPAQVLDQGQLEHAGPRPQLADSERGDGLVGVDEPIQPPGIESRVAVAELLDGHGIDAGGAGDLARGQLGELAVVAGRKVMADLADLAFHQVVVVEQPLGGGRDRFATSHVAGQDAIGVAKDARVVGEAAQ